MKWNLGTDNRYMGSMQMLYILDTWGPYRYKIYGVPTDTRHTDTRYMEWVIPALNGALRRL